MIKKVLLKILLSISLKLNDLLYRRPYFDRGSRKIKAENEIPHLDLVITECCSLKCRDCSNLMQYYQKPENLKTESIIQDLTNLLQCVRVGELNILGGETFVNQNSLTEILCTTCLFSQPEEIENKFLESFSINNAGIISHSGSGQDK